MIYQNMAVVAGFLLFYSLFAGRFESRLINGPAMYLVVGMLLGTGFLNVLTPSLTGETLGLLAELTLAIVLFTDAANANLKILRQYDGIPLRLLLVGLPLTLIGGWLVGRLIFDQISWLELALLATILAPTDAALGKAVVTNPKVPGSMREGLNVESGLNDGICVPVLMIFLALLKPEEQHNGTLLLSLELLVEEIGVGVVVGVALALLTVWLIRYTDDHHWERPIWRQLTFPGLAVLSYATAQWIGGSGFIAAFVCGITLSWRTGPWLKQHKEEYLFSSEGYAELLSVAVWLMFGSVVVYQVWPDLQWQHWLYAVASLTLLRMLPVYLCLWGSGLSVQQKLFMGWFGPRGLASIVFVIIVMQYPLLAKADVRATAICTVLLSVILHGISANPWVNRLQH